MQVTRRQFFRICAAGVGSSSLAALGFAPGEALAEVRRAVAAVAVHGTLLRGGGALLLAWLLFRRRELGKRV